MAVFIVTNLVYVAWASGEEQWWNSSLQDPRKQSTESTPPNNSISHNEIKL